LFSSAVHSEKVTEKKPRFGTLPVLNMPKRTHDTPKPKQRTPRSVVKDLLPVPRKDVYENFKELCRRTSGLKSLNDWNMKLMNDRFVVKKMLDPFLIPEFEIIIDDSLGFTIGPLQLGSRDQIFPKKFLYYGL